MNRNTIREYIAGEDVEVVDVLSLNDQLYQIRFFALGEAEDATLDKLDELGLYLKSIKHDKDGYTIVQYTTTINQPATEAKTATNKETVTMNTINFAADGSDIIVIDTTPTKRTQTHRTNAPWVTLLPAVSESTMRERMQKDRIAKREAEVKQQLGFRPTPKADVTMKESVVPAKTTPSIQAELDMLKHIISTLTPEAHAEAVKQGLIRGAQAQFNRSVDSIKHVGIDRQTTKGEVQTGNRSNAIGKRQRAEVIKRECACGCGQLTGGNFAMGHDARAKGMWLRMLRGTQLANEVGWKPNAALIAYAIANPQWSAEIYAYVMGL